MPTLTENEIADLRARFTYDPRSGAITRLRDGQRVRLEPADYNRPGIIWRVALRDGPARRTVRMLAHRAAFVLHAGRNPVGQVDHMDGDPTNNAWSNLREASHATNMRNSARRGTVERQAAGRVARVTIRGTRLSGPPRRFRRQAEIETCALGVFFAHDLSRNYPVEIYDAACRLHGFDPDLVRLFEADPVLWGARWITDEPPPPHMLVGVDGFPTDPWHPATWPTITGTTEDGIAAVLMAAFAEGLDDDDKRTVRAIIVDSEPADPERRRSRPMAYARGAFTSPGLWFEALAATAPTTHAAVKAEVLAHG